MICEERPFGRSPWSCLSFLPPATFKASAIGVLVLLAFAGGLGSLAASSFSFLVFPSSSLHWLATLARPEIETPVRIIPSLTSAPSPHLNIPALLSALNFDTMADQQTRRERPHAPTSRPKPPPAGEEEAGSVLKLGEFENVETLTLSEASLVIHALMNRRRKDRKDRNETEILSKTLDYLDAFARFRQKENVEAVERLLSAHQELTKFERAQIGM